MHLFRDWERLQLRALYYKNHRIFTLKCIHKDLIPVSIKLKSTLKTERAKKIVRKAEKDLLQARVKAINSILDNVSKHTALCRSQLASNLSTQRLRECQGFIEKVGEIRFTKVKQRQLNKFNNLLIKKEGNITGVSSLNSSHNLVSSQAGRHSSSLRGRRQFISFPGRQLISSSFPGRCSPSPQGRKQFSGISGLSGHSGRQAGSCSHFLRGRKQLSGNNSGRFPPSQ